MRRTYDDTTHCVIDRDTAVTARSAIRAACSTLGVAAAWVEHGVGTDASVLRAQMAALDEARSALESALGNDDLADDAVASIDDFPARIVARGDGWAFAIGVDPAAIMTGVENEPEHLAQDFPVAAPAQRNHAGWQMARALAHDDGCDPADGPSVKARLVRAYAVLGVLDEAGFCLAKKP